MQSFPVDRMVIRNDPQGLKPLLQNFLSPAVDGIESFHPLTVQQVVFGKLMLKIQWDFVLTHPIAGDLYDGRVQ